MAKSMREITEQEYLRDFSFEPLAPNVPSKGENALKTALDVRKFEIELYWKRATYFWTFLTLTLGAYFTVLLAKVDDKQVWLQHEALLILSCLGIAFSVCWSCVNRGSKFWQENWEKHVDLLEDANQGPLYKTVMSPGSVSLAKFWEPYPFSVSKLNQILSFFIIALFVLLLRTTLIRYYSSMWPADHFVQAMLACTGIAVLILLIAGRTKEKIDNRVRDGVRAWRRETKIELREASAPVANPMPTTAQQSK